MVGAACKGYDPRYWDTTTREGRTTRMGYVKIGGVRMTRTKQFALAKAVCAGCPVITDCLALGLDEEEGIWGGRLPEERRLSMSA